MSIDPLSWWHVVTVVCAWLLADAIKIGLVGYKSEAEEVKATLERERWERDSADDADE